MCYSRIEVGETGEAAAMSAHEAKASEWCEKLKVATLEAQQTAQTGKRGCEEKGKEKGGGGELRMDGEEQGS